MKSSPLVSVVITTRNEEKHIENCLKSIKNQDYENIEVIVVDNHSTDNTRHIAKKHTQFVYIKGPERSAQRNFGMIEKSRGKYLMYLDADMTLSPTVISDALKMCDSQKKGALYISEIVTGDNYWSQVRRFERSFYDGTVIDCVRFIRKDIFIKSGGFDISMTGPEDWDLDKKIRLITSVGLLNTPIFHNEKEFDIQKYLAKKSYYENSFAGYIKKWGRSDPDISKQFNPFYRCIIVFIEDGKFAKVVKRPLLFMGILVLRFLVGLTYLKKIIMG